jgi:hypothetical protein
VTLAHGILASVRTAAGIAVAVLEDLSVGGRQDGSRLDLDGASEFGIPLRLRQTGDGHARTR